MIAYMLSIGSRIQMKNLNSLIDIKFHDLVEICEYYFGKPRILGCHYIFETPWSDDPAVNIQQDGLIAKPYQIKIVKEALEKLEEKNEKHGL